MITSSLYAVQLARIIEVGYSLFCCNVLQIPLMLVKVYAVVVNEDKVCKVLPKMSTTGDEVITLDPVERGISLQ